MSFSDCSSAFSDDDDNNMDLNSTLSSLESSVDFDEEYDYFQQEEEKIKTNSSASKTKSASSLTLAQKRQRRHSSFSLFTKGISPSNYPTLLSLELASISGDSNVSRIAYCFRQERQVRLSKPEISNPVKFDLTYHSLLFDVIKINLLKPGFLGQSHSKYGQAVLKLSDVEYKDGEYMLQLPFVAYKGKEKNLGSVKLNCHFYNFVRYWWLFPFLYLNGNVSNLNLHHNSPYIQRKGSEKNIFFLYASRKR